MQQEKIERKLPEQGAGRKKRRAGSPASVRWGCLFLLAALLLQAAARMTDGFGQWYALTVYPVIVGTVGRLTGLLPVSVSELGIYLIPVCTAAALFRLRKEKKRFFSGCFCLAAVLFFLYTVCCGINYFCRPFSSYLEYKAEQYTKQELEELVLWLTEQVNESYTGTGERTQRELARLGVEAMQALGGRHAPLSGYYPRPKPLLFSRLLSVQQLAGIYSPFTVEANYNREMTPYNIPHTICHELSHLKGFMREDEANFIGFLACIGSEDPEYRYSGYLSGWIYAGNALAGVDRKAYLACRERLRPEVDEDLHANSAFWYQFESQISEAAETLNDTYLKANRQTDGVLSYGRVVDLMLAWYQAEREKSEVKSSKKIVLLGFE